MIFFDNKNIFIYYTIKMTTTTTTTIHLSPDKIVYEPKQMEGEGGNLTITRDIYKDAFNVIIGRKKSYLLYQNTSLLGYCLSGSFGMEVIRNLISNKIEKSKTYQIIIKNVDNMKKVYLYEVQRGMIYNSYPLIEKYRLVEIPRVELKDGVEN
jgi:hypothetical protein